MIVGTLILFMLVLGQTISFINYDFTVSLGLQESKEIVGDMGVAVNKGFGVGDTIIYLPILILGLDPCRKDTTILPTFALTPKYF